MLGILSPHEDKLLLLAFFDGRSTYAVDLSIHRETGKKGDFSLSKKERSMQFNKERSESNPDYGRFKELDAKKNDNVVKMIGLIRVAFVPLTR